MSRFLVFLLSVSACVMALVLERMAGINWDYHPDVVTYITEYKSVAAQGLEALPNQLYYFITDLLDGSVPLMITLNILAYCTTNVIVARVYADFCYKKGIGRQRSVILLVLLLFAPYRLHLAIHALKDTLIILSLCIFTAYQGRTIYSWLAWVPLLLLRIYAGFYTLILVRGRILLLIIVLAVVSISVLDLSVLEFLQDRNEAGMHSRVFDTIPSFSELGIKGTFLRMIIWPLLTVTGTFAILSPALLFIPVAIEMLVVRTWSRHVFGHLGLTIGLMMCLAVIAAFVDSFTAYLRYAYPALVVMPIIIMRNMAHVPNIKPSKLSKALQRL